METTMTLRSIITWAVVTTVCVFIGWAAARQLDDVQREYNVAVADQASMPD